MGFKNPPKTDILAKFKLVHLFLSLIPQPQTPILHFSIQPTNKERVRSTRKLRYLMTITRSLCNLAQVLCSSLGLPSTL